MRVPRKRIQFQPPSDSAAATEDKHDEDVFEFLTAIDAFKRKQARQFPSWTEVLGIVKELGYKRDKKSA